MKIKLKPMPHQGIGNDPAELARPDGITDYAGEFDGFKRTWKEFVPSSYDGSKPYPLVVSLHGGGGPRSEVRFSWALVGKRENFLVLFPQSLQGKSGKFRWNTWSEYSVEEGFADDVRYIDWLLAKTLQKYNVDPERIYITGQSLGDMMTCTYLFSKEKKDNIFAAAAPLSGPGDIATFYDNDGNVINGPKFPMPVVRTHGSEDVAIHFGKTINGPRYSGPLEKLEIQVIPCMRLWLDINKCEKLPKLSLRGRYNVLSYKGEDDNDFHFYGVEKGVHNPCQDIADYLWSYFFSGYRRVNGKSVKVEPDKTFVPDKDAIVLADGAEKAYVNNTLVDIGGKSAFVGGNMYVPVSFLEKAFPEASISIGDDGMSAEISWDGNTLQCAAGNRAVVFNEYLSDLPYTLWQDGILLVPIGAFAGLLKGCKTSTGQDICYISETEGQISFDFAYLIRQILGTQDIMEPKEMIAKRNELEKLFNAKLADSFTIEQEKGGTVFR